MYHVVDMPLDQEGNGPADINDAVRMTYEIWDDTYFTYGSFDKLSDAIYQCNRMNNTMNLNDYANVCHEANEKWWQDPKTGERISRNKGELLCLIHSEISEAMEGERKNLQDDKLPHRRMAEVELVDALIRIFDYAGGFGYDLQGAFDEKMAYNANRVDHTHAARLAKGGKAF